MDGQDTRLIHGTKREARAKERTAERDSGRQRGKTGWKRETDGFRVKERERGRQEGESVRQGVMGDQASREQSFVEGGLKITSSFVKHTERRRNVCENGSLCSLLSHETWRE